MVQNNCTAKPLYALLKLFVYFCLAYLISSHYLLPSIPTQSSIFKTELNEFGKRGAKLWKMWERYSDYYNTKVTSVPKWSLEPSARNTSTKQTYTPAGISPPSQKSGASCLE